ncbi:MAG: hypothetical protein BGO51_05870 [Rhodospirillales bacterium 69-11]|nr:MAG: hypothetical protein BGO51_05870 [Rhodospirillales bacterium 69-11]
MSKTPWTAVLLGALILLWPAAWNGYPIVFSDTGTYLSQAIEHYLGWDRPPVYSLFMLPLHLRLSTWPVVAVQALLASHTIALAWRCFATPDPATPAAGPRLIFLLLLLAAASWLPWLVCDLTPDLFTPLLVLALAMMVVTPDRLRPSERIWVAMFAGFMIATQLSSLPLAAALLLVLLPLRRRLGGAGRVRWGLALAPPVLAMAGLVAINLAGHGRAAISPYGNVFLLARVIYDGPGMAVLQRDCPAAGWRLCTTLDAFPPDSDGFLWRADSPVQRAGGHKIVSAEANAIILAALRADPIGMAGSFAGNWGRQLVLVASGDGLEPWPATVAPVIRRHFPGAEVEAYAQSRQARGILAVPATLARLHVVLGAAGLVLCLLRLPNLVRTRDPLAGLVVAVVVALLAGAAITGGLSMPHDRYQARLMWLPACAALLLLLRPASR